MTVSLEYLFSDFKPVMITGRDTGSRKRGKEDGERLEKRKDTKGEHTCTHMDTYKWKRVLIFR